GGPAGASAARRALPCGVYLAGGLAPPGAAPSPSAVRPALSSGFPDLAHARCRPQTAGGAARPHGHSPHLGAKPVVSSTPALRRYRRRAQSRRQPLGGHSAGVLVAGQGVGSVVPRQILSRGEGSLPRRRALLGRERSGIG